MDQVKQRKKEEKQTPVQAVVFCVAFTDLCTSEKLRLSEFGRGSFVTQMKFACCKTIKRKSLRCYFITAFKPKCMLHDELLPLVE